MSTLASLRILLGLDSGDVSRGAGKVRQELTGVQRSANTARDALKGVAAGFGLGVGLGAFQLASRAASEFTDLLGDSLKAAVAEEAGIKRLDQSLKANVAGWDGNRAAIERVIEARQALGFADDEQRDAMARALVATNDVARAQDVLATAMDLARLKGIDLGSATDALIKIEGGQFRALKALGIELRDGATQTEALAAVQKVAAGQADEFSKTTAGAMAAAGIAVDNLKEDFGAGLMPVVAEFATFIRTELVPGLREAATGMADFGDSAGNLLGPVGDLAAEIDRLTAPLFVTLQLIPQIGAEIHNLIVGTTEEERAAIKAAAATREWAESERTATAIAIAAVPPIKEMATGLGRISDMALDSANGLDTSAAALRRWTKEMEAAFVASQSGLGGAADAFETFGPTAPLTGSNGGATTGDAYNERLRQEAELRDRQQAERDRRNAAARSEADRRNAEAERKADQAAAEQARRDADAIRDRLADQFEVAKDRARDYFDTLHEQNLRAIDDIRDRANEELTAQQKAIRGVVSAEQARINAVRAREQENSLRGAVAEADTPEDRAGAQRDLNRFLEDQRVGRMSANADIAVALIDAEKAKNDAIAAEATKAENTRAADQRAAFDDEIAALQKNLSRHPELWAKAQEAIKKLLRDSVPDFAAIGQAQIDAFEAPLKKLGIGPPSVTATSPNATATGLSSAGDHSHVIHNHLYLNGQEVMDWIERGLAKNSAIYNPLPVSTGSQR